MFRSDGAAHCRTGLLVCSGRAWHVDHPMSEVMYWVVVPIAFSVGLLFGWITMAVLSIPWHEATFRRGMDEGLQIHEDACDAETT